MNTPACDGAIWDIDIARHYRHGQRRFDLALQINSSAGRLVLFGPSGAGKSQTLQMMAGLVRPDRGHIRVSAQTLFDSAAHINLSARQRQLGYVFQDYALFPHLTVLQNIAFGLARGWRNPARNISHSEVERWLLALELQPLAGLYPAQLSGGQCQRTALARALVTGPKALLLDEPFAALDRPLRLRLRDELRDLQQQIQLPMLLITHDEDDVAHFAQDIVHLAHGRVHAKEQS
ncbi:Sulfate/thiosulfate import ATP-binding protein CysA [Andreprevotia sp. IGB-42]|uniref:ATP-binding cassette domain-containing protein n=1 Tax=Andreprevotia sp. IGB-42 TaxID=2497473 RepID=UPI0013576028|nr:ATP-binding cassette domain-containing protein [Andreprevotia sp. IGB-42]KAF0811477.1 Sulfate/thiosulfate import ATP-binding protein CysA [Andreprevotia sp. IGB-42]